MTKHNLIDALSTYLDDLKISYPVGRVKEIESSVVHVSGLSTCASLGDWIRIDRPGDEPLLAEVIKLNDNVLVSLPEEPPTGVTIGSKVILKGPAQIAPADYWLGRIIDPFGNPLDGKSLLGGAKARPIMAAPPPPAARSGFGERLTTGLAVTNTILPIVEGQRVGLFAGSGVGKSSMLGQLAKHMKADVVVIALIGERGRELRHFVEHTLGDEGLGRAVVVAATSDKSPLQRRRCAWTAMAVAEHFRETGKSVLLLADSITRFAEAHREVATAAGEAPVLRGYPPSTSHQVMSLCERAGTGITGQGNITAIFSVLVAGSDMDEPIADILRGVLDGHFILDRSIAERGRYPAIDVLRSVSRSLPLAATDHENEIIGLVRKLLGAYEKNETMIQAGLYASGSDAIVDQAINLMPEIDTFLSKTDLGSCENSFQKLELILRRAVRTI